MEEMICEISVFIIGLYFIYKSVWQVPNVSKRFKIEFTLDGYDDLLCSVILDGKNEDEVIKKFNSLDLESRRDIVVCDIIVENDNGLEKKLTCDVCYTETINKKDEYDNVCCDACKMTKKMEENACRNNEIKIPMYVGGYQITGKGSEANSWKFMFVKKPSTINRFFCRILLGWVWVDNVN